MIRSAEAIPRCIPENASAMALAGRITWENVAMKAMKVEAVNSPSPEITKLPPYNKIPVTTKTPSVSETGEVSSCRNTIFNKE